MARIRGADTKPELLIRRSLHRRGFRFRLHDKELPGRPDIVLPRHRAAVFVHGCFWHGHRCHLFRVPATRTEFWLSKIGRNADRDKAALTKLQTLGWRTLIIWECALRGGSKIQPEELLDKAEQFIRGRSAFAEISGNRGPSHVP